MDTSTTDTTHPGRRPDDLHQEVSPTGSLAACGAGTIGELFAEQAARRPGRTAVTHEGGDLSYAELDAWSDRIADGLRGVGVPPEGVVGICFARSPAMIAAVLGVIKAGGAYLGLEPGVSSDRLAQVVTDSATVLTLADSEQAATLPRTGPPVLTLDALGPYAERGGPGEDLTRTTGLSLAYLSFTSGSTGRPKAVGVPHQGVVRLVKDCDYAELGPDESILQFAPLAFDASTFEIWGALLNGGRLVIHPPGPLSLDSLAEAIGEFRITTMWLTAGLFSRMADEHLNALGGLRQLLAGGDTLSTTHVNRVIARHPGLRLVNGYGPTENTTFTCCHTVSKPAAEGSVPIGTAVSGTGVHILDDKLNPVPDGQWGELYATGLGLARGYVGHFRQTAARFLPDPFSAQPGGRMYRTGDVCRRGEDGTLEFHGRNDDQVKIRGFRVEPGEVEAFLRSRPGVREAVVVAHRRDHDTGAGDRSLSAFVVPDCTGADPTVPLRIALNRHFPHYLVPSSITCVDEFPLTPNGKIDRSALPVPHRRPRLVDNALTAPETELERVLCGIWAEVLEVEEVGVHDDLFELGGNSLMAVDLVSRIQDAVEAGASLTVRDLFGNPSVAELSTRLLTNPHILTQD